MATKYAAAKKARDLSLKARRADERGRITTDERKELVTWRRETAAELFPSLTPTLAQRALEDLITYNRERYAARPARSNP